MKNNYNTLLKYILDNSNKEYQKETVNGLFRSILEPVTTNSKFEACILFRLFDINGKESLIKRLAFSGASLYSFSDILNDLKIENIEKQNIWNNTEFVIINGSRYSVAMIWDYSLSSIKDAAPVCLIYNSKVILDILKCIEINTLKDIKDDIFRFIPDRRENSILNKSINLLADNLNEKNEEILFSEIEKKQILKNDDRLETATIVAEKAKFIAHEIKNNLSIINLYSKISQKRLENITADEEIMTSLSNALNNITNASENISNHINDLRCLSAPYKTNESMKQLIYSTVMQCSEKAKSSTVDIEVNDFEDVSINIDKTKFQCALMNIIFNGIEACTSGCKIKVDCISDSDNVRVIVSNNGDKIPEELQDKIFESEFTTKEKGNGLGLAICKKQLELTDGTINLVSSDENETVFEILIKS